MANFLNYLKPLGTGNKLLPGLDRQFRDFFQGTPEKHERKPTLLPEQMPGFQQLQNAAQEPGAGGAFGTAADYYRNLLSNENADLNAFSAPELRRFREDIIPGLLEQFAGIGSGGLDSSSFRNAAVNAGTDLSERLGAIRAQLRQNAAQGLTGIGGMGLGNFSQDVMTQPGSEGFLSQVAPAIGTAAGAAIGGPVGAAIGGGIGSTVSSKGKTSPYGGLTTNAIQPPNTTGRYNLPGFGGGRF